MTHADPAGTPAGPVQGTLDDPRGPGAGGHGATFAALDRAAAPVLMGVALKVLHRRDAAEDVLQEAFADVPIPPEERVQTAERGT